MDHSVKLRRLVVSIILAVILVFVLAALYTGAADHPVSQVLELFSS